VHQPLNRKLYIYFHVAFFVFLLFVLISSNVPFYFPILLGFSLLPGLLECLSPRIYFNKDEIFIKYFLSEETVQLAKIESLERASLFIFVPGFQSFAYQLEFIKNRKRIKIRFIDSGRYLRNPNFLEFIQLVKGQNGHFEKKF
jgi:hypothetical protein